MKRGSAWTPRLEVEQRDSITQGTLNSTWCYRRGVTGAEGAEKPLPQHKTLASAELPAYANSMDPLQAQHTASFAHTQTQEMLWTFKGLFTQRKAYLMFNPPHCSTHAELIP